MEYTKRVHRVINIGILLISAVLLISAIPFADNAEGTSYHIRGWVYEQGTGNSIENVKVTLFDPDTGTTITATTDEDGYFVLNSVSPGHYVIHYSHPRYLSKASAVEVNSEDVNLIDVYLTAITGVNDATLTGHIQDSNGIPASEAYVYLIDANHQDQNIFMNNAPHALMTKADSNGDYTFDNAYTGTFTLVARLGSSRYYFGGSKGVTLNAGNNTDDLTFTNYRDGSKVYVKVFDGNNQFVNDVSIYLYDRGTNSWNSSTTNPGRIYVTDGSYDLIVRAPGYMTHIQTINVAGNTAVTVILEEAQQTERTSTLNFTDWEHATLKRQETRQFDDSPLYVNNEWGLFQSGIIRYDVDRFFGNGDASLSATEANNYETFLNAIGHDGDYTGAEFRVGGMEYKYDTYTVSFDEATSDAFANDTLAYTYAADLTAKGQVSTYDVDVEVRNEHMTVNLPNNYEVVSEGSLSTHDENDTTVVYVDGTGTGSFVCAENTLPTPVIRLSNDFIPNDGIYLYRTGEFITFNASDSTDESHYGKIMSYHWDFEAGNTNDTMTAVRTFTEGTYNVVLEVTDNAGGTAQTNITLIVDGTAPTVDFSVEPGMVNQGARTGENTIVYLNITALNDANGIFDRYLWDFGDGNTRELNSRDEANTTYNYLMLDITKLTGENEYTYTISLTVWDKAGNNNTVTHTVIVKNTRLPDAYFTVSKDAVPHDGLYVYKCGDEITFNATDSTGKDMDITAYHWDFGDGTTSDEMVVNHTYTTEKEYNVTLKVTDEVGGTSITNRTIYVDCHAPTVTFSIEGAWYHEGWYFIDQMNGTNPQQSLIMLNASGTHDNGPVGAVKGLYNYTWAFIDGSPILPGMVNDDVLNINITQSYTEINSSAKNVTIDNITYYYHTITLTVWDLAGNSASFSRNIIVNDTVAPVARFTFKNTIDQGTAMDLNASKSTDNTGIAAYSWSIQAPDGSYDNRTGMVVNVTFKDAGTYTVTLTVTDIYGNKDTHQELITVNRIPKPDILVNSDNIFYSKDTIKEGDTISILANITNQGDKEAFNVTVKFYFRTGPTAEKELIGEYTFKDPIVPSETRLANITYKAKKSGQIVVNATMAPTDPPGNPQVDADPSNNEGVQDIYVEEKSSEINWVLWGSVISAIVILAVAGVIFVYKPELVGIKPAKKTTTKKTGTKKRK